MVPPNCRSQGRADSHLKRRVPSSIIGRYIGDRLRGSLTGASFARQRRTVWFCGAFAPPPILSGAIALLRRSARVIGFFHKLGSRPMASSRLGIGLSKQILRPDAYHVNTKNTFMTSNHRPRGRPSKRTQDRPFQMRVSATFLRTVDDWRRGQIDVPSRAEAIRRMVELAAKMKKKTDDGR
jgi:hypothetical protein